MILFVFVLALFLILPLAGLMGQFHTSAFIEVVRDPSFAASVRSTLIPALCGSAFSVFLGLLFARPFANYQWRGKRLQRLILLIPYLMPNFILAIAYVIVWNPATGLLNHWVRFPLQLYGISGMTLAFAVAHMPVAFLMAEEKLRRIDPSLKEAARLCSARPFTVFRTVEFPLLVPTLASAFGLCFALSISAFAIPAWLGAPARAYPFTYKVYQAIQLGGLDGLPEAAAYALVLFGLAMLPFLMGFYIGREEKKYVLVSGKSSRRSVERLPSPFIFQGLFWICQLVFWLLPFAGLALSTLTPPGCLQSSGISCLRQTSFQHYSYVIFGLDETQAAIHGSLYYGAIASLLIVALSLLTVVLLSERRFLLQVAAIVCNIPLATPGAIIALGLIVLLSGRYRINLYNTPWIAVIAFTAKYLSLSFQPLRNGFANLSRSLLEAASLSGASASVVWRKIVFPILRPEILGAFFLVFIPIMGELTMSVFLASPSFKNIGTVLFDLQDYADNASAGALAILLVIMILCFNELAYRLSRGKLGY